DDHRVPVSLVEVVAGDDRGVLLAQLLGQRRLALQAHAQRIAVQARDREDLPLDLEDGVLGPEREGLLGAAEGQAALPQLVGRHRRRGYGATVILLYRT